VDRDQVTVHVEEGEVTLEGTVDSWREYRKAVENAWEGGAWSVDNNLDVR
jgi:osmotically-inducible protein OsmY